VATNEPALPQTAAPVAPHHLDDTEREDIAPPGPEALDERDRGSARPRRPMGPGAPPDQAHDDADPTPPPEVPPTAPTS
jgi:hypothetical protein